MRPERPGRHTQALREMKNTRSMAITAVAFTLALLTVLVERVWLLTRFCWYLLQQPQTPVQALKPVIQHLAPARPAPRAIAPPALPSSTTVVALRALARERGLPSRLWKSARKADLVALLT